MAPRRSKEIAIEVTEATVAASPSARQLAWVAGVLGLVGISSHYLWKSYGNQILETRGQPIQESSIEIPPTPKWIRTDIRKDAVRDGGLTQYSISQEDLTLRVAQAFAMHPWVAGVRRVTKKLPSRVVVELEYRRPVAMVEVTDPQGMTGLFPIDREGVFLLPADFMPEARPQVALDAFPRLVAEGTYPTGTPGTPWGDVRIHRGAILADYLGRHWSRLGLVRIVAHRGRRQGMDPGNPTFDLRTAKGTVVLWGHAPGDELAGEATLDKKLAQLADFVQQHGTLDSIAPDQTIDVRHAAGLEVATVGRQLR